MEEPFYNQMLCYIPSYSNQLNSKKVRALINTAHNLSIENSLDTNYFILKSQDLQRI